MSTLFPLCDTSNHTRPVWPSVDTTLYRQAVAMASEREMRDRRCECMVSEC